MFVVGLPVLKGVGIIRGTGNTLVFLEKAEGLFFFYVLGRKFLSKAEGKSGSMSNL